VRCLLPVACVANPLTVGRGCPPEAGVELCALYTLFILLFFSVCMKGVSGKGTKVKRRVEVEMGEDY
jgi:hypothetical protein